MLEKLKKYLENNENIIFAYLFGSFAQNTQTPKSDIDIAVYLKDTSFESILSINYELSKLLQKDVDLLILNSVKNIYLLEDILTNGKVIKDSKERLYFEYIKEHQILDYKAFRSYIDAA